MLTGRPWSRVRPWVFCLTPWTAAAAEESPRLALSEALETRPFSAPRAASLPELRLPSFQQLSRTQLDRPHHGVAARRKLRHRRRPGACPVESPGGLPDHRLRPVHLDRTASTGAEPRQRALQGLVRMAPGVHEHGGGERRLRRLGLQRHRRRRADCPPFAADPVEDRPQRPAPGPCHPHT